MIAMFDQAFAVTWQSSVFADKNQITRGGSRLAASICTNEQWQEQIDLLVEASSAVCEHREEISTC